MPSSGLFLRVYSLSLHHHFWQEVWQQTSKRPFHTSHRTRPPSERLLELQPLQKQHGVSALLLLAGFIFYERAFKGLPHIWNLSRPHRWRSDGVGWRLGASGVGWRDWVWFNASALHIRDQLVGDLCQDVFSQSRHAQHVVSCSIHVVPERDKLLWKRKKTLQRRDSPPEQLRVTSRSKVNS